MKELKLYQCEICGTQYSSKVTCEHCESIHIIPKAIYETKYTPVNMGGDGLPTKIIIEFENGKKAQYRR